MPKSHAQPDSKPRVRGTREETTKRILDAAEELFATQNPGLVSVREVAQKAGVTHALVHQYVGSKDELIEAVLRRAEPDRQAIILENPEFKQAIQALIPSVLDQRLHSRTLVRTAMNGLPYDESNARTVEMLINLAREAAEGGAAGTESCRAIDARYVVMALLALSFGMAALEDWLPDLCQVQDEDPAAVREQVNHVIMCVADFAFPA